MDTSLNIVMIEDANNNHRNIIAEYGRLTVKDIKTHGMNYIFQHTSQVQSSIQMYHCIYNYITEASHLNILAEVYEYKAQEIPVGKLLFKLMTQKAVIDTRYIESHLRENHTTLKTYINTENYNTQNFNQHVKVNMEGLKSGGERKDNLMTNLFK